MNFDIQIIKRKMLVKYPFFGSIVVNVDYKIDNNTETAGTDGKVIYYNPYFLEKLSQEEQIFIFAHEICHIAFNHILRSKDKDSDTWNIATDAVINSLLKKDGLKMVEGGVDIPDAINYNAEELYEKLLQEKQQLTKTGQNGQSVTEKRSNNSKSENSSASSQTKGSHKKKNSNPEKDEEPSTQEKTQNAGHDTHSMWEDVIKKYNEDQIKKDKKENLSNKQEKSEIEKKQKEIEQLGEKETFKKNSEEKKKALEDLRKTLSEHSIIPGSTTNSDIRNITNIGREKPLVDWRYLLKETTTYDVDWSYKNSTIEDGVICANLEEKPMPETEIVIDTSGSIDETLLKNFLKECKNIFRHTKLKVGCFDIKFYGFNEIRTEKDIENMEFLGGGGTDFNVAINSFSKRVENKIIFTDGYAYMPDIVFDAIWIVFGETKINPKGGKVININKEQLNKLSLKKQDSMYKRRIR